MNRRIERVLTNEQGIGVARHADAGYDEAREFARRQGVLVPMAPPVSVFAGLAQGSSLSLGAGVAWIGSNNPNEKIALDEAIATYCFPSIA